jgi:polyhydroxybutyrate depolymerase
MTQLCWSVVLLFSFFSNVSHARLGDRLKKLVGASQKSPAMKTYEIPHGGRTRIFHLFVPPGKQGALPIIFSFHGGGGEGLNMDEIIRLTPVAAREGFLVVYPEGIDKGWNDGRPEKNPEIDDVGFFDAMLAEIPKHHPLDSSRIFVTGMSNGGLMSFRLACERSSVIAGFAPVITTLGAKISTQCKPSKRVAILNILSDKDPLMPFNGGQIIGPFGVRKLGEVLSSDATVKFWVSHLGCGMTPKISEINSDPGDGMISRREIYPNCANQSTFERIVVVNGGHTWPGGKQYMNERRIGKTSRDFDGSEIILQFFKSRFQN